MTATLDISTIRLDGGTQPRASIDVTVMEDYALRMADGAKFPPVVVFYDGTDYWAADGFHRIHAARDGLGLTEIEAEVRQGTQRDAILYSCGANAEHGMRRTNADKHRAVMRLLEDPEWSRWSDSEIARRCAVSHPFVAGLRPASPATVTGENGGATRTYTTKHGTAATMNTGGITAAQRERWSREDVPAADPAPTPRPAGYREAPMRNAEIQIEGTLQSIWIAFQGLPRVTTAAVAVPNYDPERADKISLWFGDLAEELRDRAERV